MTDMKSARIVHAYEELFVIMGWLRRAFLERRYSPEARLLCLNGRKFQALVATTRIFSTWQYTCEQKERPSIPSFQ